MTKLNNLIGETSSIIEKLKTLILGLDSNSENRRIKIAVSDINNTLEHAKFYTNELNEFDKDQFMYGRNIISLVDSISINDFGVISNQSVIDEKWELCNELISKVEEMHTLIMHFND
jgi:hypothetical protein